MFSEGTAVESGKGGIKRGARREAEQGLTAFVSNFEF
jgi:hypothetical protein